MKQTLLLLALSAALPLHAFAKEKTVVSCHFTDGKQLLVKQIDKNYRYHFGKQGKWELVFANPLTQIKAQSERWAGVGRTRWTGITMVNGEYEYQIISAFDSLGEYGHTITLYTNKGEQSISTRHCNLKKPYTINWDKSFD